MISQNLFTHKKKVGWVDSSLKLIVPKANKKFDNNGKLKSEKLKEKLVNLIEDFVNVL